MERKPIALLALALIFGPSSSGAHECHRDVQYSVRDGDHTHDASCAVRPSVEEPPLGTGAAPGTGAAARATTGVGAAAARATTGVGGAVIGGVSDQQAPQFHQYVVSQ